MLEWGGFDATAGDDFGFDCANEGLVYDPSSGGYVDGETYLDEDFISL